MEIIVVQLLLALILFFIVNWIGKYSYSIGYMSIEMFVKSDDAPAFNFVVRILTPVVYLLLVASALYLLDLDAYVYNFYAVSLYYIVIRLVVNLLTGRGLLLNWYKQIFYWCGIMVLSYYTYEKIIITKKNLIPDFTTLSNELWIIVLIFLYQIFNRVNFSNRGTIKRKDSYLRYQFSKFSKEYGVIINSLENKKLIILAYSILINENFNRPYVVRFLEKVSFFLTRKPHTLGIMQVQSNKMITDRESVLLGVEKIKNNYIELIGNPRRGPLIMIDSPEEDENTLNYTIEYHLQSDLIELYNGGSEYQSAINQLMDLIENNFFEGNQDKLMDGIRRNI